MHSPSKHWAYCKVEFAHLREYCKRPEAGLWVLPFQSDTLNNLVCRCAQSVSAIWRVLLVSINVDARQCITDTSHNWSLAGFQASYICSAVEVLQQQDVKPADVIGNHKWDCMSVGYATLSTRVVRILDNALMPDVKEAQQEKKQPGDCHGAWGNEPTSSERHYCCHQANGSHSQ